MGSHAGVTAQPNGCHTVSAGAVETGDRIANETADSLRSAVLFGACGALIASLGDLPQVVLADINRQPPMPATRPFPVNRSQGVNGPKRWAVTGKAADAVSLRSTIGLPNSLIRGI